MCFDFETYNNIQPLIQQLVTMEAGITNAISPSSIELQVFDNARLVFPNPSEERLFERLVDLDCFTDEYTFRSLLSGFGFKLFCYGNFGWAVDRSNPHELNFWYVPHDFDVLLDFEERDQYPHLTMTRISRQDKLSDGYGRPYLHAALPAYANRVQTYHARNNAVHSAPHLIQTLTQQYEALEREVVGAIGLDYQENDTHHFPLPLARQLFDETARVFTEEVLVPFAASVGATEIPVIQGPPTRPIRPATMFP